MPFSDRSRSIHDSRLLLWLQASGIPPRLAMLVWGLWVLLLLLLLILLWLPYRAFECVVAHFMQATASVADQSNDAQHPYGE